MSIDDDDDDDDGTCLFSIEREKECGFRWLGEVRGSRLTGEGETENRIHSMKKNFQ